VSNLFWFDWEFLPIIIVVMLVAFTVHEFAHAWTAWKFGDDTAYLEGRVTLNPMVHLDWIGMLFLLIAGFGWAKPVPVRRSRFRKPRLMSILVTAAGPISNLLLAFLFMLLVDVLSAAHVFDHISLAMDQKISNVIHFWIIINLSLFIFNLIPIPPLDGYRILQEFLPIKLRIELQQREQWGTFIFLLVVFIQPIRAVTIEPLFNLRTPIIEGMAWLLNQLFASVGGSVFF
jgi:Zn-dependent protease